MKTSSTLSTNLRHRPRHTEHYGVLSLQKFIKSDMAHVLDLDATDSDEMSQLLGFLHASGQSRLPFKATKNKPVTISLEHIRTQMWQGSFLQSLYCFDHPSMEIQRATRPSVTCLLVWLLHVAVVH
jgi:hypothetical protein